MITHIDTDKCTGCGICEDLCPLDTIRLDPFQETYSPCRQACPAGVDVRAFLYYLKNGMLTEASVYLQKFLPFPAITGLMCHHPCEKGCARKRVDDAVNIHGLEYYIGKTTFSKRLVPKPLLDTQKVAVIGSGPFGLSAAYFLTLKGYAVTVFESNAEIGGSFIREVREGRLPMDVLDACLANFNRMGITFLRNKKLTRDMGIKELRDQNFDAILLAIGADDDFLDEILKDEKSRTILNPTTSQKESIGVFADKTIGSKKMKLVEIIGHARKIATSIDFAIQNNNVSDVHGGDIKKVKNLPGVGIKKQPRLGSNPAFDKFSAIKEARRCMTCGALAYIAYPEDCMTCFDCEVNCPSKAIAVHPFKEVMPTTLAITPKTSCGSDGLP